MEGFGGELRWEQITGWASGPANERESIDSLSFFVVDTIVIVTAVILLVFLILLQNGFCCIEQTVSMHQNRLFFNSLLIALDNKPTCALVTNYASISFLV